METELYSKSLIKWPGMSIVGKPVLPEQASKILIRTDTMWFSSNEPEYLPKLFLELGWVNKKEYEVLLGIHMTSFHFWVSDDDPDKELIEKLKVRLNKKTETMKKKVKWIPDLGYLHNQRIISAYIGGPHGWCDWQGRIGCNSYNIGKWPSVQSVHDDWIKIAKAFPYLDLTCQLFDQESGSEIVGNPVIEFRIKDGVAEIREPCSDLPIPATDSSNFLLRMLGGSQAEIGIQPEVLAEKIKELMAS